MRTRARCSVGLLALLGACTLEPRYQRPTPPIPARFPEGGAYPDAMPDAERPLTWEALCQHPRLREVVRRALAHNRDLRAATANIRAARARHKLARAGVLPTVAATATARGGALQRSISQDYTLAGGTVDWEIDLFGRLRSQSHAAEEAYLASEAGARAVRLTLIAETVSAWLTIAAQRSLLAIATQTEASARESARVMRTRFEGGLASELAVHQAETIVAQASADVAAYTAALAQAENALVQLVGTTLERGALPGELAAEALLAEVPAGIDSGVLLARPDVLEAEHMLKSANADIGAARAAFFPRLSLTALGGLASSALTSLVTGGAAGWQVAGELAQPLFTGGANLARLELAKAERDRSLAVYEGVVQRAFREVADALARRGTIDQQREAQRALVTASEAAYRVSDARYRAGADSYLNALDAQRTLYGARRALVLTELSRAETLVSLYRALGGG